MTTEPDGRATPAVVLIYPYANDDPLVVVNPPANLAELVAEWQRLDAGDEETGEPLDGWEPVDEWLEARGVVITKPTVYNLDN